MSQLSQLPQSMHYELRDPNTDNDTLLLHETLFHNANGYIGVRSCLEEGCPEGYTTIRGSYINGFYDLVEMKQAEKLYGLVDEKQTILNVADAQSIACFVGGEPLGLFTGETLEHRRALDMAAGVTTRRLRWRAPSGGEVEVSVRRMASFVRLPLFLMEYTVASVDYEGSLELRSTHQGAVRNFSDPDDPRVAADSHRHLVPREARLEDGVSLLITDTAASGLTVCTAVAHRLNREADTALQPDGHGSVYTAATRLRPGESVTLTKYCVFCDSIRYGDCAASAAAVLQAALAAGTDTLYQEQADYLAEYWANALLEIDGDEALNQAVRFNLYQLIASVGKDPHSCMPAKGLSGEGYEGHYFWDTEMYIQPFFNITSPHITRNLLTYRYNTLDYARENARLLGHRRGALYPWRTIMGRECSGYFPSGGAQYHINGDIAYSVTAYYLATGDLDFLAEMGAEILFETARLWLDVGVYNDGRFHIHAVTGPDEYTCLVNNNYFTNVSAQHNLKWAARVYWLLDEAARAAVAERIGLLPAEVDAFDEAARRMYLPYDEKLGINPQDDSFLQKKRWDIPGTPKEDFPLLLHYHPMHLYRHQVCKQADTVLAHFVYEDAQPLPVMERSFAYYEAVTTHDSSLSTCIFSIVASRLGLEEKAYRYFGNSAMLDLFNTHGNTKDGIHTANMGGAYMAVVYGFGGLRIKEDGLHLAPSLPKEWRGYRFQVLIRGSRILVEIRDDQVELTLVSGEAKELWVYGVARCLENRLVISMEKESQHAV